jgi:hypothetical protein
MKPSFAPSKLAFRKNAPTKTTSNSSLTWSTVNALAGLATLSRLPNLCNYFQFSRLHLSQGITRMEYAVLGFFQYHSAFPSPTKLTNFLLYVDNQLVIVIKTKTWQRHGKDRAKSH